MRVKQTLVIIPPRATLSFVCIQSFQYWQCAQSCPLAQLQSYLLAFAQLRRTSAATFCPALSYRSRNPQDGIFCLTRFLETAQRRCPLRSL